MPYGLSFAEIGSLKWPQEGCVWLIYQCKIYINYAYSPSLFKYESDIITLEGDFPIYMITMTPSVIRNVNQINFDFFSD
jgi:hypothetical protein